MTYEYKPYLVWRNIVIWSVDYSDTHVRVEWSWQDFSNERFCSGINKDSFMYPDDSSDEMQFLKMLMDRYISDKFQKNRLLPRPSPSSSEAFQMGFRCS